MAATFRTPFIYTQEFLPRMQHHNINSSTHMASRLHISLKHSQSIIFSTYTKLLHFFLCIYMVITREMFVVYS